MRENVVCFSGAVPNAYCAGLLRPRIWVSTGAVRRLKRRELEVVLWHESYHLQRRDPLRVFVARVLSSTLVILPILRSLAERFEAAKELDADQVALRRPGTTRALAGALIKMGQRPLDRQRLAIGAWSSSHARVDQVCGADAAALLPVATARARWLTSFALAVALLLALGQAARANLVPAAAFDSLGLGAPPSEIHSCPIPHEGVLL